MEPVDDGVGLGVELEGREAQWSAGRGRAPAGRPSSRRLNLAGASTTRGFLIWGGSGLGAAGRGWGTRRRVAGDSLSEPVLMRPCLRFR